MWGLSGSWEKEFILKFCEDHISQETATSFTESRENLHSFNIPALGGRRCLTSCVEKFCPAFRTTPQSSALFSQSSSWFSRAWWELWGSHKGAMRDPWGSQHSFYDYILNKWRWVLMHTKSPARSPAQCLSQELWSLSCSVLRSVHAGSTSAQSGCSLTRWLKQVHRLQASGFIRAHSWDLQPQCSLSSIRLRALTW